jgi:archaellum component FlaC
MAPKSGKKGKGKAEDTTTIEGSYKWEEELNEVIDETLENSGVPIPPIDELLKDASMIETALKNVPDGELGEDSEETLFNQTKRRPQSSSSIPLVERPLVFGASKKNPPNQSRHSFVPSSSDKEKEIDKIARIMTGIQPKKESSSATGEYQESFASQGETADLREQIEGLDRRLKGLEKTFELVLQERSSLPIHLQSLQESVTSQMTVMQESLQMAIEAGVGKTDLKTAAHDLKIVVQETENVTDILKKDLQHEPSSSSQITSPKAITTKPKRVKLIK